MKIKLIAFNGVNCLDEYETNLEVVPFFVPNAFTPNGDNTNDLFNVKLSKDAIGLDMTIFDRWGKLLKEYVNEYPGWDGTYKGIKMPSTDYWYTINVDLNETNISGHFTLLR